MQLDNTDILVKDIATNLHNLFYQIAKEKILILKLMQAKHHY
jgi:hypothetical protein